MLHRIGRHVDGRDVVIEDKRSRAKRAMKLLKQLAHPTALGHSMGDSASVLEWETAVAWKTKR
jgi:hypothetical protein